ncbi:MAG: hypothetical protein COZ46_08335, partial [Verrucomicrobia bacterium CG_4_10_14_3_um_filter_43_23]
MKYTAGIIGLGRIGSILEDDPLRIKPHTHAGFYNVHPKIDLACGCDVLPERRTLFNQRYPNTRTYDNFQCMLRNELIDIASISAYTKERFDMAYECAQNSVRGLWIEKPLATSIRYAKKINRLIKEAEMTAIVDHRRRLVPEFIAVKNIINEGRLGNLKTVHVSMTGGLMHTGTHAYDVLDFLCGDWTEIRGKLEGNFDNTDTSGFAWISFKSGVESFISCQKRNYYIFQFDFQFDQGRIMLGNDICKVYGPGDSKNYSQITELFEQKDYPLYDHPGYSFFDDLVLSLDDPTRPVI